MYSRKRETEFCLKIKLQFNFFFLEFEKKFFFENSFRKYMQLNFRKKYEL